MAGGGGGGGGGKKTGRSSSAIEGVGSGASSREIHESDWPSSLAEAEPLLAAALSACCPAACSHPNPWLSTPLAAAAPAEPEPAECSAVLTG